MRFGFTLASLNIISELSQQRYVSVCESFPAKFFYILIFFLSSFEDDCTIAFAKNGSILARF